MTTLKGVYIVLVVFTLNMWAYNLFTASTQAPTQNFNMLRGGGANWQKLIKYTFYKHFFTNIIPNFKLCFITRITFLFFTYLFKKLFKLFI